MEAIAAYLDAHPDFTSSGSTNPAHAAASIRSQPLPLDQLFGKAAMVLIDYVRSRPGQIAARHEILQHAQLAGIGIHAARQVLSYHEAFTRQDNRLWTLTGTSVTTKATAAARALLPPKPAPGKETPPTAVHGGHSPSHRNGDTTRSSNDTP